MAVKTRLINSEESGRLLENNGSNFAVIQNPGFIHPGYEIVPLAQSISGPVQEIKAVLMDMDGTTTTSEELVIHSLEYMLRVCTGRAAPEEWPGLDEKDDLPFVVGNSKTRHVEFLVEKYRDLLVEELIKKEFLRAALWLTAKGRDPERAAAVRENLKLFGGGEILEQKKIKNAAGGKLSEKEILKLADKLFSKWGKKIRIDSFNHIVRAMVEIYYHRYHKILRAAGKKKKLAAMGLPEDMTIIKPMAGLGVFLALVKGMLGSEAALLSDRLIRSYPGRDMRSVPDTLKRLGEYFEQTPAKLAVVTASLRYEAEVVLSEVFRKLRKDVKSWDISEERKKNIRKFFSDHKKAYDTVVTASDSTEFRLKPHRDLYSVALNDLSMEPADFNKVIGFEDTESGTIALRAAGIGKVIAVPFASTANHNFEAASDVVTDGLPEVLLEHGLFLDTDS